MFIFLLEGISGDGIATSIVSGPWRTRTFRLRAAPWADQQKLAANKHRQIRRIVVFTMNPIPLFKRQNYTIPSKMTNKCSRNWLNNASSASSDNEKRRK